MYLQLMLMCKYTYKYGYEYSGTLGNQWWNLKLWGSVNIPSYPLQYSGLLNFMDRGAWQASVHGVSKSRT